MRGGRYLVSRQGLGYAEYGLVRGQGQEGWRGRESLLLCQRWRSLQRCSTR